MLCYYRSSKLCKWLIAFYQKQNHYQSLRNWSGWVEPKRYWGWRVEQEAVQQIVNLTPHAPSLARFWQCFSGTLNLGNVHFYFPDSSVLSRKQVLQCGFDLFVARAPTHLPFVRLLYFCDAFVRRCTSLWCVCTSVTTSLDDLLDTHLSIVFSSDAEYPMPFRNLVNSASWHIIVKTSGARQCTRASYDTKYLGNKGDFRRICSSEWAIKETLAHSNWQARIEVAVELSTLLAGISRNKPQHLFNAMAHKKHYHTQRHCFY